MRLFIALELPQEVRQKLALLRVETPGVRWVAAEQLHLTLAFLGDVAEEKLAPLLQALGKVLFKPFLLQFDKLGCFPHPRAPRIVWIGLQPHPLLNDLAAGIRSAVSDAAIILEDRPFTPHITLARLKVPNQQIAAAFERQTIAGRVPPIEVQEFALVQSRLTQAGAVHTLLQSFAARL